MFVLKLLFKKDTTFQYCIKCAHFSNNTSLYVYRKSFRFFRFKYWKFIFSKINFLKEGICRVNLIDKQNEYTNFYMKGYESCLFTEDMILDLHKSISEIDLQDE